MKPTNKTNPRAARGIARAGGYLAVAVALGASGCNRRLGTDETGASETSGTGTEGTGTEGTDTHTDSSDADLDSGTSYDETGDATTDDGDDEPKVECTEGYPAEFHEYYGAYYNFPGSCTCSAQCGLRENCVGFHDVCVAGEGGCDLYCHHPESFPQCYIMYRYYLSCRPASSASDLRLQKQIAFSVFVVPELPDVSAHLCTDDSSCATDHWCYTDHWGESWLETIDGLCFPRDNSELGVCTRRPWMPYYDCPAGQFCDNVTWPTTVSVPGYHGDHPVGSLLNVGRCLNGTCLPEHMPCDGEFGNDEPCCPGLECKLTEIFGMPTPVCSQP